MSAQDIATMNPYVLLMALLVVLNLVGYLAAALVMWTAKRAISDLRSLERDHREFKENVMGNFVKIDPYREDLREIKSMLRDIYQALGTKADKRFD